MQQEDKKRAPRHYYSKDSPEMKNIFAVTSKISFIKRRDNKY